MKFVMLLSHNNLLTDKTILPVLPTPHVALI